MSISIDYSDALSNMKNASPSALSSSSDKAKKGVRFNDVKIFFFDRTQGFECIPSDDSKNSITLGMSFNHTELKQFNQVDDYLKYKRSKHLKKLEEERDKILTNDSNDESENFCDLKILTSDALIDEANLEEENRKILEIVSNKHEYENIHVDLPINMDIFCPVLTPVERRLKLKEAGLAESDIDETESKEIKSIKTSRQTCGCKCSKLGLQCGPENDRCTCYSNGIKCQLDKTKFPCDCTVRKCRNPYGLKRFDQKAVLKHYEEVFSDNYPPIETERAAAKQDTEHDNSDIRVKKSKNKRKRKKNSGCYALSNKKRKTKQDCNKNTNENIIIESHLS